MCEREEIYSEEGYINPDKDAHTALTDDYAPYSTNFLAFLNGRPIGTIRITRDSKLNFPTENMYNIDKIKDRDSVVELGRLVIDKRYRQGTVKNRIVMFGLSYLVYRYSRKHGIKHWLLSAPEKLVRSFEQFGATFEHIHEGEPMPKNLEARSFVSRYFERYRLCPYLIDISTIPRGKIFIKK